MIEARYGSVIKASVMNGKLLLVIPPVLAEAPEGPLLDEHFGNNLRAYLGSFEKVTIACSARAPGENMVSLNEIPGAERSSIIVLPEAYREDRFCRKYRKVRRLLRAEINAADYLLISPHAAFDWSTLAARIALKMGRDYNMEADWNLQNVVQSQLRQMKFGLKRLRRTLWHHVHSHYYLDSMRRSRLSLLQGAAVLEAYKNVAPNPHKVFNVQITDADRIADDAFSQKIARVRSGAPLRIAYAGRAIAMKGPGDWQECLREAYGMGLNATATWVGDGDMLSSLRSSVVDSGLSERIFYPGSAPRNEAFEALRDAEIFLFCHLTDESPRCLIEALTAATPIVGYESFYACDLVSERGGGEFVPLGDWRALSDLLIRLDQDRERLAMMLQAARESSLLYDRDKAIAYRIQLMKKYLRPQGSS